MRCPSCGETAPDGSRFCSSCGRALTATAAAELPSPGDETLSAASDDVTRATDPSSVRLPDLPFTAGQLLAGRYRIVRALGKGGMGAVVLADDVRLGQQVALKFLPAALARDPFALTQFQNEVSLSRQITHPNVCRVFDIGEADGMLFLSMEYVPGEDLAHALARRGPFPVLEGTDIIWQICAGLGAVHARGVLHRDLKPANVMIDAAGQPKLMDFGIATTGTVEGVIEGTPRYMAPEQRAAREVTQKSDLYAIGLMSREILGPDLPPHIESVVRQCLEEQPVNRPASAQAVAAAMYKVLLDERTVSQRVLQFAKAFAGIIPLTIGLQLLRLRQTGPLIAAEVMLGMVGVASLVAFVRSPITWTVRYKGHELRFNGDPVRGEQLFIDGAKADKGRIGVNVTMRGTIQSGAGAGERISAQSRAALLSFSCRIIAEWFVS